MRFMLITCQHVVVSGRQHLCHLSLTQLQSLFVSVLFCFYFCLHLTVGVICKNNLIVGFNLLPFEILRFNLLFLKVQDFIFIIPNYKV